jgi:hypothetical protein
MMMPRRIMPPSGASLGRLHRITLAGNMKINLPGAMRPDIGAMRTGDTG